MSQTVAPSPADILHGLQWLRSTDPKQRARGIDLLCNVRDDPRIVMVFEHLYESDPDVRVRQVAWHALKTTEPSVPAPGPAAAPPKPVPVRSVAVPAKPAPTPLVAASPRTNGKRSAAHSPFLLNPASKTFIARKRDPKRRARSGRGLFALAIVTALLTVVLGVGVVSRFVDDYRLDQSGVTVEGTLTALSTDGDTHHATYRFDTAHDVVIATLIGVRPVTEAAYNQMREGDSVQVTYWPDNPTLSRIDAPDPDEGVRVRQSAALVAMILLVLLAVILGVVRRKVVRRQRILKGRIVACKSSVKRKQHRVCVHYRVRSPDSGLLVEGKACRVRNDLRDAVLPEAGTPATVYFRSDRHHRLL